jgi:uncharacterized surface protein with fasciclin (FAS1) repeats
MKNPLKILLLTGMLVVCSCKKEASTDAPAAISSNESKGQSGVVDATSSPNIVQVASGSKDHTTLVAAVQAASLVDVLSNAGPFTVFAPTNAAFDKLPAGTVDDLLKPENKEKLTDILSYHTYVGVLKTDYMQDGQEFEEVNGKKIKITKKDGKVLVNGSEIITTLTTSNGVIHVINDVLQPK